MKRKVGIIGLGYVGLPLAMLFHSKDFNVIGIDIDPFKLSEYKKGKSYLSTITNEEMTALRNTATFSFTDDFSAIGEVDVIILCVPTPLSETHQPDLTYIQAALNAATPYIKRNQVIILESSTYPGTTEEVIKPTLEKMGRTVGVDIFLGYSPERIDPGNQTLPFEQIPKIVSGVTEACLNQVESIYESVFESLVPVTSPKVAEMTKLVENTQRFINISFINDIGRLCHVMDIDIWDVVKAASTKPYGFTPYFPSAGIGGHCIPVDPLYLKWKAEQLRLKTPFIDLAKKINDEQPRYVVNRITHLLKRNMVTPQSKLLLIGLTYKPNTNDVRESSAITIFEELVSAGYLVSYHDPYIENITINREEKKASSLDNLGDYDCIVLLCNHSQLDYQRILNEAQLIFDTRNCFEDNYSHVYRL
ncbi:nucleotide sugar dehydrogenase [Alkalihalophilus lindianensis]|uniref:Nucleotide sugar dehydrogenase n=1 Tax=Alkalihalophilus lindianensis TaxID=1630542 RepID=A0ABU3XCP8_9BACI|nr:nucleotide sugar dehydrogenase [Alkalihalophilus lindianensis]MDV2685098.1 nucleotide sugar dehydrogenase [Alkalihalophilus lindianensis]